MQSNFIKYRKVRKKIAGSYDPRHKVSICTVAKLNILKKETMETLPYDFLVIILRNCPQAGNLYLDLWNKRNKDNEVYFPRSQIEELFLLSLDEFKKNLFTLCQHGLISIEEGLKEKQTHFLLELVGHEACEEIDENQC